MSAVPIRFAHPRRRRLLLATCAALAVAGAAESTTTLDDRTDVTYGAKIRQLRRDDGHEHNLYYNRNPWNADGDERSWL